ncbi:hypothetical protein K438DRAFT_1769278 [Mycena galopus ATCC 62051]|nr:hypothetical protein K438DRAFT_1769278 [Mycena galopus ATCC 62051]
MTVQSRDIALELTGKAYDCKSGRVEVAIQCTSLDPLQEADGKTRFALRREREEERQTSTYIPHTAPHFVDVHSRDDIKKCVTTNYKTQCLVAAALRQQPEKNWPNFPIRQPELTRSELEDQRGHNFRSRWRELVHKIPKQTEERHRSQTVAPRSQLSEDKLLANLKNNNPRPYGMTSDHDNVHLVTPNPLSTQSNAAFREWQSTDIPIGKVVQLALDENNCSSTVAIGIVRHFIEYMLICDFGRFGRRLREEGTLKCLFNFFNNGFPVTLECCRKLKYQSCTTALSETGAWPGG